MKEAIVGDIIDKVRDIAGVMMSGLENDLTLLAVIDTTLVAAVPLIVKGDPDRAFELGQVVGDIKLVQMKMQELLDGDLKSLAKKKEPDKVES